MYNYSSNNDFQQILTRLLANVSDSLDKREGSIIYDALAPAAAELAQCYIALDVYNEQSYLLTATGENLDNRVADYGLTRLPATYSQAIILVYDSTNTLMDVPIGTRFAIPNDYGGYDFKIISKNSVGNFLAECETPGMVGNSYVGSLLPLESINNLGAASINLIYKDGEDEETDVALRKRALDKINQEAFAGNKSAYRQMCINIDGVEDAKVFPVWNGGGTVELAIIAPNHTIPNSAFVESVQEIIDPVHKIGYVCTGPETGTYYFVFNSTNYQFTMPTVSAGDVLIFNTKTLTLYKGITEITTTTGNSGTLLTFISMSAEQGQGLGKAPIGHIVTVVAPTQDTITIAAEIELDTAVTIAQVQDAVNEEVGKYIYQVQEDFLEKDTITIYLSKVSAAILNVTGIKSVDLSSVTINGEDEDYTVALTGTNIKYPILNSSGVTLSEST